MGSALVDGVSLVVVVVSVFVVGVVSGLVGARLKVIEGAPDEDVVVTGW